MSEYEYILIMEDNSFIKSKIFSEEDKNACNIGIMSCIRILDLKQYCDNEWLDISNSF